MSHTPGNLLIPQAEIYIANFGAVEPAETLAGLNSTPAPSAWTHVGLTNGGSTVSLTQELTDLTADQIRLAAGGVPTSEEVTVQINMAELVATNLTFALNGGTTQSLDSGNVDKYVPQLQTDFTANYKALILDSRAPTGVEGVTKRRRYVFRKGLSNDGVELSFGKEDQQVYTATFKFFYVSNAVDVWNFYDDAS